MSFKGKVIIVTGAASGIGAATAVAFSEAGARVVIVDIDDVKIPAVAARCADPLVLHADISNENDARRIIDETIAKFGHLDVLINNAATLLMASLLSDNIMKSYDKAMNVNLRAAVHLTNLAAPHLIKTKGNIINISSVGGMTPQVFPPLIMYCVSKAALNHFGVCAALELAAHGVRVNTITYGPVRTDILKKCGVSADWDDYRDRTVLKRISEPEESVDLILFLASDKAKSITGSNYVSDDGFILKRH